MPKNIHEIRDPIHVFIQVDSDERKVIDSRPFQRLRHIHQLALTYLVYPGATHRRFEHSLGVMELAGRMFDVVTRLDHVTDEIRSFLPELSSPDKVSYWRRVLRMAALCHDIGHLPFSHAAEKELLPPGWSHENLTIELIRSPEMREIWKGLRPPLDPDDVVKLAAGPSKLPGESFSTWESLLSEIIVGDAFGADRMDYLLRDSHHSGVAYGRFDHHRLLDTMRILPFSPDPEEANRPVLGIEDGGLQSAEALALARYFMFSQLYLHPVRRIYDLHLKEFLQEWLPQGKFSTDTEDLLRTTDNEVSSAMFQAAFNPGMPGHMHAVRLIKRQHFKVLYRKNPEDTKINLEAGRAVFEQASAEFGAENVRHDPYAQKRATSVFPVLLDEVVVPSTSLSRVLMEVPHVSIDFVFVAREILERAKTWFKSNHAGIIQPKEEV